MSPSRKILIIQSELELDSFTFQPTTLFVSRHINGWMSEASQGTVS